MVLGRDAGAGERPDKEGEGDADQQAQEPQGKHAANLGEGKVGAEDDCGRGDDHLQHGEILLPVLIFLVHVHHRDGDGEQEVDGRLQRPISGMRTRRYKPQPQLIKATALFPFSHRGRSQMHTQGAVAASAAMQRYGSARLANTPSGAGPPQRLPSEASGNWPTARTEAINRNLLKTLASRKSSISNGRREAKKSAQGLTVTTDLRLGSRGSVSAWARARRGPAWPYSRPGEGETNGWRGISCCRQAVANAGRGVRCRGPAPVGCSWAVACSIISV